VSDIEHELVIENETLRSELARVREIARRALHTAKDAQDADSGQHDPWIDDALRTVDLQGA
jgi:hypothetical protein